MKARSLLLILFPLLAAADEAPVPVPNWKMLQSMDSDHSGSVSKKEFLSSDKIFAQIDRDQDGLITNAELKQARKSSPPAPTKSEAAPRLKALDPTTGKMVSLFDRPRPFALIFGTHT